MFGTDDSGGAWGKWLYGAAAPALLAFIAFQAIWTGETHIGRRWRRTEVHGADAVLVGVTLLCLAALLHVRIVWVRTERLAAWADAASVAALAGLVASAVALVICLLAFG